MPSSANNYFISVRILIVQKQLSYKWPMGRKWGLARKKSKQVEAWAFDVFDGFDVFQIFAVFALLDVFEDL